MGSHVSAVCNIIVEPRPFVSPVQYGSPWHLAFYTVIIVFPERWWQKRVRLKPIGHCNSANRTPSDCTIVRPVAKIESYGMVSGQRVGHKPSPGTPTSGGLRSRT